MTVKEEKRMLLIGAGIAIALILFFNFQSLSLIFLEDENTFYSYHGRVPAQVQSIENQPPDSCYPVADFREAGIPIISESTKYEYRGYSFPDTKIINIDENEYRFVTSEVQRAYSETSACAYPFYNVRVFKNDIEIDLIFFTKEKECIGYKKVMDVQRTYDSLAVSFSFAAALDGSIRCLGKMQYIVHKYELIPPEMEGGETTPPEVTEETESTTPTEVFNTSEPNLNQNLTSPNLELKEESNLIPILVSIGVVVLIVGLIWLLRFFKKR